MLNNFILENFINPITVSLYSLLVGSFLTACIYRIPYGRPKGLESLEADEVELEKELAASNDKISIFKPVRSFCPNCKNLIAWWQNIPVLSWFLLRGKCYSCKTPISFRYPAVELLSLAFGLLCYYQFDSWTALIIYLFCCSLIVISFIDIDYYIIPNVISYPGMVIGLALSGFNQYFHIFEKPLAANLTASLLGLAGGLFLWLISELYYLLRKKVGLGFGDVKLMAMAGLFFGPSHAIQAIFLGSFAGSILGIGLILLTKKGSQYPLPFGPYLALGIVLSIFTNVNLMEYFVIR